jgi:hypothetical protein
VAHTGNIAEKLKKNLLYISNYSYKRETKGKSVNA